MDRSMFIRNLSSIPQNQERAELLLHGHNIEALLGEFNTWMADLPEDADVQVQCELSVVLMQTSELSVVLMQTTVLRAKITVVSAEDGSVLYNGSINLPWNGT